MTTRSGAQLRANSKAEVAASKAKQAAAFEATSEREVLGTIDIGVGMGDDAWDAVPSGVPDAMSAAPSWERRTNLDRATPAARPGYVQRWVRIAMADGKPDISNKAGALQTGWRPRRAETLGENDVGMPIYNPGDGKGGVMVFKEQLLLCEMRAERYEQIEAQLRAQQDQVNKTIYQDTRRGNGMPEKYATLDYDLGRESTELID